MMQRLPCRAGYWDAYFDLRGGTELHYDEPPLGGKWPWFYTAGRF